MTSFNRNLAPFIRKLSNILSDPRYYGYIRWSPCGNSILILDETNFIKIVLTENFKHSNLNSFIRQLNKHNFHKLKITDNTKGLYDHGVLEFSNVNFRKSRPELMQNILIKRSDCNIDPSFKRMETRPFM